MYRPGSEREPTPSSDSVLDIYFAEYALGPEHRARIAIQLWRMLTPAEKIMRQQAAREIAGINLELGAEYTQASLLLDFVNDRVVAGQPEPEHLLPEATVPTVYGGGVSALPPAA